MADEDIPHQTFHTVACPRCDSTSRVELLDGHMEHPKYAPYCTPGCEREAEKESEEDTDA